MSVGTLGWEGGGLTLIDAMYMCVPVNRKENGAATIQYTRVDTQVFRMANIKEHHFDQPPSTPKHTIS